MVKTEEPTIFEVREPDQSIWLEKPGNYEVHLVTAGAEVIIRGGWNLSESETAVVNLRIIHKAAYTRSETLLRAVARDRAQITLNGTIVVEASAPNTNAFLTENILLLSPTAVAHAVPNLEINTDAVKCSHAATISPIPEQQLFYLQSRGLTKKAAENLVIEGFLNVVSESIPS